MQIVTILIENQEVNEKILRFLEHLEGEGVEILSQEESEDFKLLIATRSEPTIPFSVYLENENSSEK